MKNSLKFAFLLLIVGHAFGLMAQQPENQVTATDTLSQVVIESPMIQKSVMKLPTSYQQTRIRSTIGRAGNSPIPALNTISGVYIQSGALNTNRITIRGVGSRNPFGTNRIKAYYAGIPLTGGDGETELDDISSEIVSTAEVLKGGKSAFYGPGLGGVVLLNPSNVAPPGWNFSLSTDLGSDGLRRLGFSASRGSSKAKSYLNVSNYHFDGWRENSAYDRNSLLFVHEQAVGRHQLHFLLTGQTVLAEIPSSLNETDFRNSPSSAAANWNNVNGREDNNKLLIGLNAKLNYHESLTQELIVFGNYYYGNEFRPFNDLEDENYRLGFRTLLSYKRSKWTMQASAEAFFEDYRWCTFEPGTKTVLNQFEEERTPINVGLQTGYQLHEKWYAEAGLSANFLIYKVRDLMTGTPSEQFSYENILSPFLGLSFSASEQLTFFGSFGHGFSYPSLQETLLPEGAKNSDLKPEQGLNSEIGARYLSDDNRISLHASIFSMSLDDLLVTERIENGDGFGVNAGSAVNRGFELNLVGKLFVNEQGWLQEIRYQGNTTLASYKFDTFIDEGNDRSGNDLPGLPSVIHHSSLSAKAANRWELQIDHHFYGSQYLDDANTSKLASYGALNSQITHTYEAKNYQLQINLGVNNLLDLNYSGMVVVNAPSFGGNAPRYYYPGQPRNLVIGLRVTL